MRKDDDMTGAKARDILRAYVEAENLEGALVPKPHGPGVMPRKQAAREPLRALYFERVAMKVKQDSRGKAWRKKHEQFLRRLDFEIEWYADLQHRIEHPEQWSGDPAGHNRNEHARSRKRLIALYKAFIRRLLSPERHRLERAHADVARAERSVERTRELAIDAERQYCACPDDEPDS
jgi:hypothetical protein